MKAKPRGPFAVHVVYRTGSTFEGKLLRLTDARRHARDLLRLPRNGTAEHAVISGDNHRETMTRAEAAR